MVKLLAVLLGIVILGYAVVSLGNSSGTPPADPVTSSAMLDLQVKTEAGITVKVASLNNRMKQVMAAGNDPAMRKALDEELAKLHQEVDAARTQLTTLGDSLIEVEQWLTRIGWSEFQTLEADYHKAADQ